jgi:uncharacterized protein (DUF1501 family)
MVRRRPRYKLSRRQFVENSLLGAFLATSHSHLSHADSYSPYEGKCLVSLQLEGGADVTQFCDPKTNTPGEKKINNWADLGEPRQTGNIVYAPVANNQWLFDRYGLDTLIVNGVDAQTNSHNTGQLFNATGSNSEGKPSLTALHAAMNAPEEALSYSVFGGVSRTAGLTNYSLFDNVNQLRTLADPRKSQRQEFEGKRRKVEFDFVDAIHTAEALDPQGDASMSPRRKASLERFRNARATRPDLAALTEVFPGAEAIAQQENFTVGDSRIWSTLKNQMQGALLIFKAGLGASADLSLASFDTHDNHDAQHEVLYTHLADALGFFWDYAEELGIADRILLVIGSDFGRTNFYNDGEGKDHWPVGSYIIMERNAPWGNRVVGLTDELHFAKRINPSTLREDRNGILITPAHVHKALQEYLGLDLFAEDMGLALRGVESMPLFDSSLQSVGGLSPYARGIW